MESSHLGVRRGAWSEQEDILLKNCIQKYGEGKWHQIPLKAGLNRCRKSCRLRWFNYLRPNINRGEFTFDEVDLIIRLHKLLGNRWTLISGRLPGRTANDVKNFWNTNLSKKMISQCKEVKHKSPVKPVESTIIKPHPRTFSKNSILLLSRDSSIINVQEAQNKSVQLQNMNPSKPSLVLLQVQDNSIDPWLESNLQDESKGDDKIATPLISWPENEHIVESLWGEEATTEVTKAGLEGNLHWKLVRVYGIVSHLLT